LKVCTVCWDKSCNHSYQYKAEIDDNISDIICILNRKGYKTLYCCGGHISEDNILQGYLPNIYIAFNKYNSKVINMDTSPLGENWTWNKTNATLRYFLKEAKQFKNKSMNDKDILLVTDILNNEINRLKEFVILLDK